MLTDFQIHHKHDGLKLNTRRQISCTSQMNDWFPLPVVSNAYLVQNTQGEITKTTHIFH
jgi:hypothetical protein